MFLLSTTYQKKKYKLLQIKTKAAIFRFFILITKNFIKKIKISNVLRTENLLTNYML